MNGRCNAEIGGPGKWHMCNRKATVEVRSKYDAWLQYCERHVARANEVKAPTAEVISLREVRAHPTVNPQ